MRWLVCEGGTSAIWYKGRVRDVEGLGRLDVWYNVRQTKERKCQMEQEATYAECRPNVGGVAYGGRIALPRGRDDGGRAGARPSRGRPNIQTSKRLLCASVPLCLCVEDRFWGKGSHVR